MRFLIHILFAISLLGGFNPAIAQVQLQNAQPSQNQNREAQRLGIQYYQNRDFVKSLEVFSVLYSQEPSQINYTYYLYSLLELSEYKEAEKLAKKHAKNNPGQMRYQIDIGFIYLSASEPEKAKKKFEDVIDRLPANVSEIMQVANAFNVRNQTEYAIQVYLKGRELMGDEYNFDLELANMYERNGNYPQMIETFLDHLEKHPEARENIQNRLQSALTRDIDNSLPDILHEILLIRYQESPDKVYLNELLLWFSLQQKDFAFALVQAKSLDRRFNEEGYRILEIADLALNNRDYDAALESYEYIMNKGRNASLYLNGLIGFLETRYQQISGNISIEREDMLKLEMAYHEALDEFGVHQQTIQLLRDLAHIQAFHLDNEVEAIENLLLAIDVPGPESISRAQCKLELADIYLFISEVWEATLLYSQVEKTFKNEPIGHLAKLKNARLTYYIGEFFWAKAQLDVLKAATSKLIANDALELSLFISDNIEADSSYAGLRLFSKAELLLYQNKLDEAFLTLDSINLLSTWHPLFDEVLYKKAEIWIQQGNFNEADSLLQAISTSYPDDILGDDAIFLRAKLHEEVLNDPEQAMELYQKILTRYPGSIYTIEARKKFRSLRGDGI